MTVGDLLAMLYRDLNYATTPSTPVTTELKSYLNSAYRAILTDPRCVRLRDTLQPLTFASVVGQSTYGLPANLNRIYAITERDNDRRLVSRSLSELRAMDPGVTSSGTPWAFVPMGYGPLIYPPASTGIWAASSNAADTTQVVQINGVRASGFASGDVTATLTGTSRVQIGTFTDYVDVQMVTISAVAVGLVTLYDAASSGNTLAQIPIGQVAPKSFRLQLFPVPGAVITYYVDGQRSEEHTSELQSRRDLVCRLLLEKK